MTSEPDSNWTSHAEGSFFDPARYLKEHYSGSFTSELERLIITWAQDQIHSIFAEGRYKGKRLLDVGSGPVVYAVITASKYFDECYVSDISPANVDYLQHWIQEGSDIMKYLMEEFVKKEGNRVSWEVRNNQVREKVKNAVISDVCKPNPVSGTVIENIVFDAVTSCLCLSVAVSTIEDYRKAIQNCGNLLEPGGRLFIVDTTECPGYSVGSMKFKALVTAEEEIKQAFQSSGYEIEDWETYHISDSDSMYSVVARKL